MAGVLLFSGAAPLYSCNSNQVGANANGDGGDGGGGGGGGGTDDGGLGTGDGGDRAAYCSGSGPPIVVGDANGSAGKCSGDVAATVFRYGLCICQGLSSSSPLTVDAFDSSHPGAQTLGSGGSVGMNSNLNASSISVGGNLQVSAGVTLQSVTVGQDALIGDRFSADQTATIGRNAQIGSDVICNGGSGALKITGNLTYPSTKTLTANSPMIGSTTRAAVTVAQPCDCSQSDLFDIASYVQQRQTNNDNAAIGLDSALLMNYSGDQNLDFPCGRFYIKGIGGQGKLNFNITGRTALFIDGDVNLSNAWNVTLGPSGELDLFINGGLTSSAPLNFGNINAPAKVRVYMGGSRNINLSSGGVFGGNIYAPQSSLVTSASLEVYGAVFVYGFNPSGTVKIHHDIAILNAADACNPAGTGGTGGTTGPACTSCRDCGSQACTSGHCGACTTSADCCAPLSCYSGKCEYVAG